MRSAPITRWRLACLALIGVGGTVSAYLLARAFTLLANQASGAIDVCSAIFGTGCDDTLLSPTSFQLGLPLAGWGLVYFGTLACLLLLAWALGQRLERQATLAALALGTVGAAGSAIMSTLLASSKVPFCPLCVVIHVTNFALFAALWRLNRLTSHKRRPAARIDPRWRVVAFLLVGAVALAIYAGVYARLQQRLAAAGSENLEQALAEHKRAAGKQVATRAEDPRLGPADAPVQLVVFSSFQCPGCRAFARDVHAIVDRFDGSVALVFMHYPLSTTCNPAMRGNPHPHSCEAAWAAEAARRQGAFWPYHDGLFATDLRADEETLRRVAAEVGLDLERFDADRSSEAARAKVAADIDLGIRLGVNATPTVFVNGNPVQRLSPQVLVGLIERELNQQDE